MSRNYWKLCNGRTESICKAYNLEATLDKGNGRYGVSYSITFYCGNTYLYEMRDRSPMLLFEKLAAFDWGMESMVNVNKIRSAK